ncbi:cation-translocating P-type ATPase [Nocardioides sp. AN3]
MEPREGGLSSGEAARRLEVVGPNEVPRPRPRTMLARIGLQLADPMILMLCAAFVIVCWLGDASDAVIIAAVVALNTTLGVLQERRAEHAMAALDQMAAPHARVLRDGDLAEIAARDVVPDDLVRLEAGDVVPADLRLVEAVSLMLDEASLTGESVPVSRGLGEEVQAGTVVTRGRGFGVAVRTGAASGLGRIAALVASAPVRRTPLQTRLGRLSRQLIVAVTALAGLVLLLAVLRGDPFGESLVLAVSLAVAAIPESLPAAVSVALALGAYRMAQRSAIVRWLPAVETLGSVSILASDKTGTLTEGRMTLTRLWLPEGVVDVPAGVGAPWSGVVDTAREAEEVGEASEPEKAGGSPDSLRRLLRDLVLCNDARLVRPEGTWSVVGDPMEGALLLAAVSYDAALLDASLRWPRVAETPFDSVRQCMETVHDLPGGRCRIVKGAPEVVLGLTPGTAQTQAARAAAAAMAADGFRVLAVAEVGAGDAEGSEVAQVVGLVGLVDPPKPDAASVVAACREAGIRTVLVTGDHPATALAIARQVGVTGPDGGVVDGAAVTAGEHAERLESIDVFARIKPDQKVDIVDEWQRRGHVVAMTGDGVNDAPALRRADIGVAMGDRGTEVARQAADLVLADDNLRTVVTAVGEGRRIYANIRTFLRYALSGGLAEVLVILLAPFLGMPAPLLPGQILWINMLTHGVPGVAFGAEPLDPALMRQPSPSPQESVLGRRLGTQVAVGGLLITLVTLVSGLLAVQHGWHVSTTIFATLGFAQLGVALALRAPRSGSGWAERAVECAVATSVLLQTLAIVAPPLRALLGTEPLPAPAWALVLALATLPGVLMKVMDRHGVLTARRSAREVLVPGGRDLRL